MSVIPAPTRPPANAATGPTHHRRPSLLLTAVTTWVALVLGACSIGGGALDASMQSPQRGRSAGGSTTLQWSDCDAEPASLAQLECATLPVPLDHSDPDGETIELALARTRSQGAEADRIGSLVLNPGGPGGSGIEFLANAAAAFPGQLSERFDLVSFDPRGVGASSPVRCLDDQAKDEQLEGDLSPDTEAELEESVEEHLEFVESCETRAEDMIRHMSTADVAADLDVIREALGDDELSYVGFSYGTSIGATYATLFPDNVRAMVLDGATSPSTSAEEELLAQGKGFERTLASFVEHCDADPECALGPDSASAIADIRAGLERDPVTVETPSGTRTMGVDLFDIALATAMYDTTVWGAAANSLATIRDGGAALLFTLVDRQIGRNPDGTYDNSSDAQAMVNCADEAERPTLEEGIDMARRVIDELPTFGEAIGWGALGCHAWPEPANPLPPVDAEGAPPILVVGTVNDPATPYEWSQEMAEAIESAVLLTYEGDGHTAFLRGGPCIDDAVVTYLVELQPPAEGTSCPAQTDAISFAGLRDEVVSQFVDAGLPESIASCVVDGMVDEIGEAGFDQLILSEDIEQLSELVSRHSIRCAAGGG